MDLRRFNKIIKKLLLNIIRLRNSKETLKTQRELRRLTQRLPYIRSSLFALSQYIFDDKVSFRFCVESVVLVCGNRDTNRQHILCK